MARHQHDLLIVTDATGSMGSYLTSLTHSIPEILALTRLSGIFSRVGVLAYRDYCDHNVIEWSGWDTEQNDLLDFAARLTPSGGGDYPEAAKTAMIHAMQKADYTDESKETIVLFYTDASPHHDRYGGPNWKQEQKAFKPGATDWVTIAFTAKARHLRVFSFISARMDAESTRFYAFLSQVTGGVCLTTASDSQAISRITIDVLLNWMGAAEPNAAAVTHSSNAVVFDVSPLDVHPRPKDENKADGGFLVTARVAINQRRLDLACDVPRAETLDRKLTALARRFADVGETEYRATVYSTLREIITRNVFSLTYNAVFGQLWRAVCREQTAEKEDIVQAFGLSVGKIADGEKRKGMTQWLEESYDSTAEIEEMMKKAGEGGQWMYLDLDAQVDMTRVELLEASRSYHRGLLRQLASIFTHAKLVEPGTVLTEHQRAIPLSLPPRHIFRLLPHLVVPGTLYSSRASAVMAILALTVGVPFLRDAATTVAGYTKGTWLDLEHPETLSWECASFLLNAPDPNLCLTSDERKTYEGMRRYRLLELNLDATLDATVPWTPEKASGVGDVKVPCALCGVKRSTTMMSNDLRGVCGLCVDNNRAVDVEEYPEADAMESCWVECAVRTCRAQYVVEKPSALNVRPKCWYCRNGKECPHVTCTVCTNRIVVPKKFAPSAKDLKHYKCPACATAKRVTLTNTEVNPRALVEENGTAWLGISDSTAVFKGSSAFKLYKAHGSALFTFVDVPSQTALHYRAKYVLNTPDVIKQLDARVGRGEVARRTCALCFDDFVPDKVRPACGRSGCAQRVCEGCLREWYGRNEPGKLLNAMELTCPFCRRIPVSKVVLRFNPQVGGLKGVKDALEDRAWFYAWCGQCSTARQCIERRCTTDGRLPEVKDFVCETCEEENAREVERLEEERRQLAALVAQMDRTERYDEAQRRLREIREAKKKPARDLVVKECPNKQCGVMVSKTWGCDHITCRCGVHWCWVCQWHGSASTVYKHLNTAHGGFYTDAADAVPDEDEDEDEDGYDTDPGYDGAVANVYHGVG
ncbi:hypothetical protein EXIGLDRAFT_648141 [Exidia glandulosa HHB12029]|uniref:RING-type domain-containing protein n=1 Tax=Exidia glandulosa HHB12029 TaxID=1314781 RepID=A0A165H782_EXIGL|nr:hypothetical protein EXIGLDRAFT_648141 [Exidia glandulosa HHB12029]